MLGGLAVLAIVVGVIVGVVMEKGAGGGASEASSSTTEAAVAPGEKTSAAPAAAPEPVDSDRRWLPTRTGPQYEIVAVDEDLPVGLDQYWVYTSGFDSSTEAYKDQVRLIIADVAHRAGTDHLIVQVVTDREVAAAEAFSTFEAFVEQYGMDYVLEVVTPKEETHWVPGTRVGSTTTRAAERGRQRIRNPLAALRDRRDRELETHSSSLRRSLCGQESTAGARQSSASAAAPARRRHMRHRAAQLRPRSAGRMRLATSRQNPTAPATIVTSGAAPRSAVPDRDVPGAAAGTGQHEVQVDRVDCVVDARHPVGQEPRGEIGHQRERDGSGALDGSPTPRGCRSRGSTARRPARPAGTPAAADPVHRHDLVRVPRR